MTTTPTPTPRRNTAAKLACIIGMCSLLGSSVPRGQSLMPSPYFTVFDSAGNPVSGACIWVYLASTSTPTPTYTSVTLGTPNTNPIVADSAGRFGAWLAAGISYKFQFETACTAPAHGSVIRTVDGVMSVPGTSNPTTNIATADLRCSLVISMPVTHLDTLAAGGVYVEPYQGNRIALYDGATWNMRTVVETPNTVPNVANAVYDLFARDVAGTPTYVIGTAWTNDTSRAVPLVFQDGILTQSGSSGTLRYLCSFRTTAVAGQTEDSARKRYLWNYAHRVRRPIQITDAAANWSYATATIRQANANVANQADVLVGWDESTIDLTLTIFANNTIALSAMNFGIGEDSTTVIAPESIGNQQVEPVASANTQGGSHLVKMPGVGRHVYPWLEQGPGAGTQTWVGTTGNVRSGLTGTIDQ